MAQDFVPTIAKVVRLEGPVRYSQNGGANWKMLKVGDKLAAGVLIQTAKEKSWVDLQLGPAAGSSQVDGRAAWEPPSANMIRLSADSAMEIQKNSAKGEAAERVEDVSLNLRAGQVLAAVAPTPLESKYTMTFDTGAVALQPGSPASAATVFVLKASGDMAVLEGTMMMAKVDKELHSQVVSAGERFDATTSEVSKLPPDAPERKLWPP